MKASLFGVVMILLCINIFLFIGGVRVVDAGNSDYAGSEGFLSRFVSTPSENDLFNVNQLTIAKDCDNNQDCIRDATIDSTVLQQTGGSGLSFVDIIRTVISFVKFLVNIVFTPIGLFMTMPSAIGMILGVPMLFAGILGLIYFIRSGA